MSQRQYICNVRQLDGPLRCTDDAGHEGDHHDGDVFWPNDRDRRRKPPGLRQGRPPQRETYEHELSEAFTNGVKATLIHLQLVSYGIVRCEVCKRPLSRMIEPFPDGISRADAVRDEVPAGYFEAVEEAMSAAHKHHLPDRVGHGYRPKAHGNDFGHDDPVFIALACGSCHRATEPEPFSSPPPARMRMPRPKRA